MKSDLESLHSRLVRAASLLPLPGWPYRLVYSLGRIISVETKMEKSKHASDCAVHNAPALPIGPCDCGALIPPDGVERIRKPNKAEMKWAKKRAEELGLG